MHSPNRLLRESRSINNTRNILGVLAPWREHVFLPWGGMLCGLLLALCVLLSLPVRAEPPARIQRQVAVVLDTSTSMRDAVNDRPRLAIQAIKILADLLGPADDLSLAWMPASPDCNGPPDAGRRIDRQAADLAGFKQALDARARYGGPTNFIVPLLTVKPALDAAVGKERLLIVISDAGRDTCRAESTQILSELRAAGVHTAVVSLGERGRPVHSEYDIRTAAQTPSELLSAIGEIYQRFLGAKAPDSGRLSPDSAAITAEVPPFVDEAFLLVAAEGPVGAIDAAAGNPAAVAVEPDYRAGETRGLDDLDRGYRILRLRRPAAGTWRFNVSGLTGEAGWYLIQDFSVSMRVAAPPKAAQGEDTPVTLELIDDRSGSRIARPGQIPGLVVKALVDGTEVAFRDDGQEGDQTADDGVMTARVRFMRAGPARWRVQLASRYVQDEQPFETQVVPATWVLEVQTPPSTFIGNTIAVAVQLKAMGAPNALRPPDRVRARFADGRTLTLRDDGRDGDRTAGDGIYGRDWTPDRVETAVIDYTAEGGGDAAAAQGQVDVKGTIAFGPPGVLDYGRLTGRSEATATLDLGFVQARGRFDLQLSSDFSHWGAVLEIDAGEGFKPLSGRAFTLGLPDGGNRRYPVRLRVGNCPAAVHPDAAGALVVEAVDQQGQRLLAPVLIRVEIVPDYWLRCWWPVIAAILLVLLGAFILYGILSPARFPRTLAVILSPEADMDEGYPFNIRSQRGGRSGFYRDARIYITSDFQLRRAAGDALVRLRASRLGVFIQALPGSAVLYLDEDNRWEPLNAEQETRVRFSTLYKNAAGTLFFEFRNL
ncbi:vWA domain-containing protein [uncultured Thiodictyon sp.]|uniref:vWA domain-containing protein n=1 Tax=uncultured Thiodictyon sp. TaxID=1846217 RepID=UPI0025DCC1B0|nr:vWA domain-containing protein [uncultured Thiodictyon sp.]